MSVHSNATKCLVPFDDITVWDTGVSFSFHFIYLLFYLQILPHRLYIVLPEKKAIVIINKNNLEKKVDKFIQEKQINKDPTDRYQKQIQQTIQRYNLLIDKQAQKFLIKIKPTAPKLNIYSKTCLKRTLY